jgi:predicted nucleic-acid-binding protein
LIGVDTNVIVRLLVRDDPKQYDAAVALVTRARQDGPLFVNPLVIAETVWVLERRYNIAPDKTRPLIRSLLETVEFHVPVSVKMSSWVDWLSAGHVGFSDIVIAATNAENGCTQTYTFDQDAAKKVPGMELLA